APGGPPRRHGARLGRVIGGRWRVDAQRPGPHGDAVGISPSSAAAVITPRRTRLIRAADLHEFRAAIATFRGTSTAVVVPTRAAATQLARAFPDETGPLLVTRDQLYDLLHSRLENPPARLNAFDREAIAQAAADEAARRTGALPFHIRPGLVSEMLRFYDQLRWQLQSVNRFDEL